MEIKIKKRRTVNCMNPHLRLLQRYYNAVRKPVLLMLLQTAYGRLKKTVVFQLLATIPRCRHPHLLKGLDPLVIRKTIQNQIQAPLVPQTWVLMYYRKDFWNEESFPITNGAKTNTSYSVQVY